MLKHAWMDILFTHMILPTFDGGLYYTCWGIHLGDGELMGGGGRTSL